MRISKNFSGCIGNDCDYDNNDGTGNGDGDDYNVILPRVFRNGEGLLMRIRIFLFVTFFAGKLGKKILAKQYFLWGLISNFPNRNVSQILKVMTKNGVKAARSNLV